MLCYYVAAQGDSSTLVQDLLTQNAESFDGAGVSSWTYNKLKVRQDGKLGDACLHFVEVRPHTVKK